MIAVTLTFARPRAGIQPTDYRDSGSFVVCKASRINRRDAKGGIPARNSAMPKLHFIVPAASGILGVCLQDGEFFSVRERVQMSGRENI